LNSTDLSLDFSSLPLSADLLTVVQELGYEKLTPIQAQSIPHLLAGKDLVGQAKTGSGKTAAFALPILNKIDLQERSLQALILCPARELASQVVTETRKLGRRHDGLQVLAITGGVPSRPQITALESGLHIAVGTPGRVLDLIQRGRMDLSKIKTLVLDEAYKMFEMGFEDEIKAILKELPRTRQTAFFSATFPETIQMLSNKHQKNPIKVTIENTQESAPQIEQFVYAAEPEDKISTLMRVLQQHPSNSTIVFCNMKVDVNELAKILAEQDISSACLHGDLDQRERDRVMAMFRNGSHRILIATDVAARGLDIENLELVINFDLPLQPDIYVHRIGRTGRAGRSGVAVSLATSREALRVVEIEKFTGKKFERRILGFKNQHGLAKDLRESAMKTISISGGRKDKLRPGDILGALTGEAGGLSADKVGKIEIQDRSSYVAITASVADIAFERLRQGRIKGKKFQVKFMK
jgi:ATP-independent RNA helicase DbpA